MFVDEYRDPKRRYLPTSWSPQMRILLVEDDEVCRNVLELTLRRDGQTVTSVSTGAEALALLEGGIKPDLLLTDIHLQDGIDGWLLARIFQDILPDHPVVYITATPAGACHVTNSIFLLKPLRLSLLLQAIGAIAPKKPTRLFATLH